MSFLDGLLGKPSMAKFAQQLIGAFRQAGDTRRLVYQAEESRLVEQGGSSVVNLSNLHREHCSLPRKERGAHLRRVAQSFLSAIDELPEDYEQARPNLRPKIWSRAALTMLDLKARLTGSPKLDLPVYPLGDHLYSSLVYDLPHSMRSLDKEQLDNWGVSYFEAMEAACENLQETTAAWAVLGDSLHSSMTGDNYDSSRALLISKVEAMELRGAPVAMIPNRDTLLITGDQDEEGLAIMLKLCRDALESEPRPLAPVPLRLTDGDWDTWMPPAGHSLRPQFVELENEFLGQLYGEQKELLEQIHEEELIDVFVASYSGVRRAEEEPMHSYSVWGRGVDTLLPRTEFVVCVDDDGLRAAASWEKLTEVAGDLIEPDESHYPPRYRVREFPSATMLEQLGVDPLFEKK